MLEDIIKVFSQLDEDNQRALIMVANGIKMGQEKVKAKEGD